MAKKRKNRKLRKLRKQIVPKRARSYRGRRRGKPGSAPGTLVFREDASPTRMHLFAYGPDDYVERDVDTVAEAKEAFDGHPVVWLDVVGLGSEKVIRSLGTEFGLHGLLLEDLVNTHQRAKVDTYPEGLYTVVRMPETDHSGTEQVSILLTSRIVITVQEHPGDVLDAVRERIRTDGTQMRKKGCDYLLYAIVDAVIDSYFPVLEALGERLDALEEEVMGNPTNLTVANLHAVRRELVGLRRAAWPHRDMVNALIRDSGDLFGEEAQIYLRDAYDHAVQIMDFTDSMRDNASDLLSAYMTVVSNRMNEVMKVLTIIATLFIPLTFIVGVYGMNFDTSASPWNMPELGWAYGYPVTIGFMLLIAIGLLMFFRHKGWL